MNKSETCYHNCTCTCNSQDSEFENLLRMESKLTYGLREICHSNIAWFLYSDHVNESLIKDWNLKEISGLYILWHKNDYCDQHKLFHMKALYVGKGKIEIRLIDHFKNKNFNEEMLIYFTHMKLNNRMSKYLEQLFLDIFKFPLNSYENSGNKLLCQYFTQEEVD